MTAGAWYHVVLHALNGVHLKRDQFSCFNVLCFNDVCIEASCVLILWPYLFLSTSGCKDKVYDFSNDFPNYIDFYSAQVIYRMIK